MRIDPTGALDSAYTVNVETGEYQVTGDEGGNNYDVITYVNNTPVPRVGAMLKTEVVHSGGGARLGPGEFLPYMPPASGAITPTENPLEMLLEAPLSATKAVGTGLLALVKSGVRSQADELPEYVFHYTTRETAELISKSQLGRSADDILYLTPNGNLSPLQAQLDLALPKSNTAEAVFRVNTAALDRSRIEMIRRVTGNVFNRPGGGTELLYRGTVNLGNFKRIK